MPLTVIFGGLAVGIEFERPLAQPACRRAEFSGRPPALIVAGG